MRVDRTGRAQPAKGGAPPAVTNGEFAALMRDVPSGLPEVAAAAADAAQAPAPPGMSVRDRDARRHGEAMLRALATAQADLLGGTRNGARRTLASLAANAPPAADPHLDALLRAIAVRAAVEAARGT